MAMITVEDIRRVNERVVKKRSNKKLSHEDTILLESVNAVIGKFEDSNRVRALFRRAMYAHRDCIK